MCTIIVTSTEITPTIERRRLVHQESSSSLGTVSDTSTQDSGDLLNSEETAVAVNAAVKTIMTSAATVAATMADPVNISDVAVSFPGSEVDQAPAPPLPTSPPPLTPDKTTPDYYDNPAFSFASPGVAGGAPSKLATATKPPPAAADLYHLPPTQQRRTRQTGQVGVGQYPSRRLSIEPDKKIKLELIWVRILDRKSSRMCR